MGLLSDLGTAAYNAVSNNEVGGKPSIAYKVSPPASSTSGWAIGFNQEDFTAGVGDNKGLQAQTTLESALVASGKFDQDSAEDIAAAFTAVGKSTNPPTFSGITDVNGNAATLATINAALQTTAGSNSIATSSLNDFTAAFNTLNTNVLNNSGLTSAVQDALADPVQGPLLTILLADYSNQYGAITPNSAMMEFLTTGNVTINGNNITIDTTSAASVVQSVMEFDLSTRWITNGGGANATSRLAEDVNEAVIYDASHGETLSTSETLTSEYGAALIDPNANGVGVTLSGSWTSLYGPFQGTVSPTGNTLDLSGLYNTIDVDAYTIELGAATGAAINGFNDAINAANNAAVALGAAAANNAVSLGNGASLDDSAAGGTVAGGVATITSEPAGATFTQVALANGNTADVDSGNQASITGTDGTETVDNAYGAGSLTQNSIDWNAGGSQLQTFPNADTTGLSSQYSDYSGANETGTLDDQINSYVAGGSAKYDYADLASGVSTEVSDYSGSYATGTLGETDLNFTAGGSQEQIYNPSSGVAKEDMDYSGANETGDNTANIFDWTAGGSQEQVANPGGDGLSMQSSDYAGADATGTLIDQINTYSSGGSAKYDYADLAEGVSSEVDEYTGANGGGSLVQSNLNLTSGGSQEELYDPSSGVAKEDIDYSGTNETGTDTENIFDWTAGGSQVQTYPNEANTGLSLQSSDYTGEDGTGTLDDQINSYAAGGSAKYDYADLGVGVSSVVEDYSGFNAGGSLEAVSRDYSAGGSQDELFPGGGSGVAQEYLDYAGANETGVNTQELVNYTADDSQVNYFTGFGNTVGELGRSYSQTDGGGYVTVEYTQAAAGDTLEGSGITRVNVDFSNDGTTYTVSKYDGSTRVSYDAGLTDEGDPMDDYDDDGVGFDDEEDDDDGQAWFPGDDGSGEDDAVGGGGHRGLGGGSGGGTVLTMQDGQTTTVTGNSNSITVENNDTLTLDINAALSTAALSGNNSTVVDSGFSDAVTVSGSSDTVDFSGGQNGSLAGAVTTFDGASDEQIASVGGETVTVNSGVQATLIGSDGTVTVNNSGATPHNTINWNAGGSEVQSFTTLTDGGTQEEDQGYTGSDGSGTLTYTQITTTASDGTISSTISGTGDVTGLINSTITLSDDASATLVGGGDTVTAGNGDTLALQGATANAINVTGNNSTVTEDSASGGNTFALTGSNDVATLGGNGDTVNLGGSSNTVTFTSNASGGAITVSGINSLLELTGASSDTITLNSGATGTLKLDQAEGFSGTLAGLADGDKIDLADFGFGSAPTISSVTGTGAAGTTTDITITDGTAHAMLALLNQYTAQFGVDASAYTLTADSTAANAGTFLQLAAGH